MEEPTIGLLATAAGLATVIAIIMNLVRGVLEPAAFDKWAPILSVIVGIVLAEVYALTQPSLDTEGIIQAVLVGLFAGGFSQNVNTIITRTVTAARTTPPA
jgi:hypothetical protein